MAIAPGGRATQDRAAARLAGVLTPADERTATMRSTGDEINCSDPRSFMHRDLETLSRKTFDLLVIGGGVLGASIARDAALRGLEVALVDRGDWACGTSSNSLRIVHGGLRYLQNLDLRRVRQSIRERSLWLRLAPHLVEPLPIVVPTHGHGMRGRALLRTALAVNDALALDRNRGLHADRVLPAGRSLGRTECLALVPELESPGLTGGVLFHDAQMYSSERLVLETVWGASLAGAVVANHVEVESALRRNGILQGVRARDRADGEGDTIDIRARAIVSAAGPAASSVTSRLVGETAAKPGEYTVGLNIGVDAASHSVGFAIAATPGDSTATARGAARQLFVVPWRGRTLFGTAHLPWDGDPAAFLPSERHIEAFLGEVNGAWPAAPWTRDDVRIVQGGLLPGHRVGGTDTVHLDARHRIVAHDSRGESTVLTVTTVKFTTARLVAEQAVDAVCLRLGRRGDCRTADTLLPGAPEEPVSDLLARARLAHAEVPPPVIEHLVRMHGRRYADVVRIDGVAAPAAWLEPIAAGSPTVFAELVHCARHEMAVTVEDLVHRRTELGAVGVDTALVRSRATDALALAGRPAALAHR